MKTLAAFRPKAQDVGTRFYAIHKPCLSQIIHFQYHGELRPTSRCSSQCAADPRLFLRDGFPSSLAKDQHFAGDPYQEVRAFNVRTLFTLFAVLAASVRDSINRVAAVSARTFANVSTARVYRLCAAVKRFSQ